MNRTILFPRVFLWLLHRSVAGGPCTAHRVLFAGFAVGPLSCYDFADPAERCMAQKRKGRSRGGVVRGFAKAIQALGMPGWKYRPSLPQTFLHARYASEQELDVLLESLSLDDKLRITTGEPYTIKGFLGLNFWYNEEPFVAGEIPARGLPGIRFADGPRGAVIYHSTCFPVAMARGATWDPALEEEVAEVIGYEIRVQGGNLFAGICINLLRHPGWGRAQETYGEDPILLGDMGVAAVYGSQLHVMACVKHFACNSIEDSRYHVNVRIDDRALHEVYLPHFKRCVDAGAASVMSAYNRVNGEYCGQHEDLLTAVLKETWGFQGFVMSDFFLGIWDGPRALNAGMDLEMPFTFRFGRHLRQALEAGVVDPERLDDAVRRILRTQARFAGGTSTPSEDRPVAGPAHRALARRVAAEGMVLLKNDAPDDGAGRLSGSLLPLRISTLERIGVFGRLQATPNLGDEGSSRVRPPHIVTAIEGIRSACPPGVKVIADAKAGPKKAAKLAAQVDTAVVVVGFTHNDEGENIVIRGGDRSRLRLRSSDEELIRAVCAANPRTVVVLIGGSAIVMEHWRHLPASILMAWYPGMEGGHALADVLFGAVSPGGKLPCVFPRDEADLPPFDSKAGRADYDLHHGYRYLDREDVQPAFPFGFGLHYTTFSLGSIKVSRERVALVDEIVVQVDVANTGDRAGSEVVQVYVAYPESAVERPRKELKAFRKVRLEPGEVQSFALALPTQRLAWYDAAQEAFVVEPGRYTLLVGTSSHPTGLQPVQVHVGATEERV